MPTAQHFVDKAHRHPDIGHWFDTIRQLALELLDGEGGEVPGRDGITYQTRQGRPVLKLHPRPHGQPPQLGLWLRTDDQTVLQALRHPGHKERDGWVSVRRHDQLPTAVSLVRRHFI